MHTPSVLSLLSTGLIAAIAASGRTGGTGDRVSRTVGVLVALAVPALAVPVAEPFDFKEVEDLEGQSITEEEDIEPALDISGREVEAVHAVEAKATPAATPAAKKDKKKGNKDKKKGKKGDKKKKGKNNKAAAIPTAAAV